MRRMLFVLVVASLGACSVRAEEPVHFVDPNLKAAVEQQLWISDPTPTDMLELTSLQAGSLGIRDLSGLEYAVNLQTLWLRFNNLRDISPLSALTNLESLVLHRNWVSDLSPLSGLMSLYYLNLDDNQISDVSALSGLTNLRELILFDNQISDVSPLLTLTSLEELDLRENPLSEESYQVYIPQIIAQNTGINVKHDRGPYHLTISSTPGGSVTQPGEGEFICSDGQPVLLEANADPCFVFVGFSGSLSTGTNPVYLKLDTDHRIEAKFESVLSVLYVDDDALNGAGPTYAGIGDPGENGTREHPFDRIQEAIAVAGDGVTIMVCPGTYRENIDFLGKNIQLIGRDPNDPEVTAWPVVDAAYGGPVVRVGGDGRACALVGFVITGAESRCSGVIYCSRANPMIAHCLVAGNRPEGPDACVVYCADSNAIFANCTITDNHIGTCGGGFRTVNSHVLITNSIFWNNTYDCWSTTNREFAAGDGAELSISYSDIPGGWPGSGNIEADPLFARAGRWVDRSNPHVVLGPTDADALWVIGDYHLQSQTGRWEPTSQARVVDKMTSPCIDAGDPASAAAREPAPHGGIINLGAYGGTSEASTSDSRE